MSATWKMSGARGLSHLVLGKERGTPVDGTVWEGGAPLLEEVTSLGGGMRVLGLTGHSGPPSLCFMAEVPAPACHMLTCCPHEDGSINPKYPAPVPDGACGHAVVL